MEDIKNTVLVTHANCPDGSACAVLFRKSGGRASDVYFVGPDNTKVDDLVLRLLRTTNKNIIVADASLTYGTALELDSSENSTRVKLLDHHKTAIPLKVFSWCFVDERNEKCGSRLLFEYLKNNCQEDLNDYYEFVMCTDDKDRWVNRIKNSNITHNLHNLYGQREYISRFLNDPKVQTTEKENILLEHELKKKEEYIERKKKNIYKIIKNIDGKYYKFGFVAADMHMSDLGDQACNDPELGIDVLVMLTTERASIRRSVDCDLDLADLASLNFGGGHAAASGFNLDTIFGEQMIKFVASKMLYTKDNIDQSRYDLFSMEL